MPRAPVVAASRQPTFASAASKPLWNRSWPTESPTTTTSHGASVAGGVDDSVGQDLFHNGFDAALANVGCGVVGGEVVGGGVVGGAVVVEGGSVAAAIVGGGAVTALDVDADTPPATATVAGAPADADGEAASSPPRHATSATRAPSTPAAVRHAVIGPAPTSPGT